MSIDSRKKLTAFYDSGKVVVTSEFVNSMFGGLHGTSAGDIIASVDPNDPRIIGHLHDGTHADGHAGKIDLGEHVQGELAHVNLGDGVVRRNNIQCYPEALKENAIPEFSVDPVTGEKCYYLNIDLEDPGRPAGKDTEIQFNDDGEFGSQAGYVFEKETFDGLKNGMMGINIQDIDQNSPYALSIFGDEQIYSDEILGNEIDLSIVFDNPTVDRNWEITGDGTFGIKKINDVIRFDSSFGREAFLARYQGHLDDTLIFDRDLDGDGVKDSFWFNNNHAYFNNSLASAAAKPEILAVDGASELLLSFGSLKEMQVGDDPLDVAIENLEWLESNLDRLISFFTFKFDFDGWDGEDNFENIGKVISVPSLERWSKGDLFYNWAAGSRLETCGGWGVAPEDYWNGNHPWSTDAGTCPDNLKEIIYYLIYKFIFLRNHVEVWNLVYYKNLYGYINDYKDSNKIIAKIRIKLHNSAARGTPRKSRWHRLDYTISENFGNAEVTMISESDLAPTGQSSLKIAEKDVILDSSVGSHTVYFKTSPCLDKIAPGGIWHTDALERYPTFQLNFFSSSPDEIIEIKNLKLQEVMDGELSLSGLLTGGGDRGVRVDEDGKLGIGLARGEYWKNSSNAVKRRTYDESFTEKPVAELHIRGETGRANYNPDDPTDIYEWATPVWIEDVPPCSWVKDDGTEGSLPSGVRGTLVIDDQGRVFVNEKIKCEEAGGGGLALPAGFPGNVLIYGAGGLIESNRAISVFNGSLENPVLNLIGTDDASNPMSFASFNFALTEDDGTGTEVTSVLSSAVASRDNLHLIGSGGSLSSGSSPFVPASGMLNIGTTSGGGYSTGLRVDSAGRVTIGDVDSLDVTDASSILVSSLGLIAGRKYKISDNPTPLDFTQFGATNSNVGTVFISNSTIASGSTLISDPNAKVDMLRGAHANRALHVVGFGFGTPPIRIEDITLGNADADWGHSLMVNPQGDIYQNVGGAQFMEVTAGEDLDAGVPISFGGFDSANGRIIVKVDGNGSLSGSSAFSSDNDTFVGITAGSALANDLILIQNYGLITSANIMLSAIPTAWFSDTTIPAGTPLKTMTLSQWTGIGSPWAGFSETKWLTLDVSSGSGHPIDEASKRNRVGFLAEDWLITSADLGVGLNPTNTGIQLENAKVFIRSGW